MWFLARRSHRRSLLGLTGTTTWWTDSGTESSPFRSTQVGKCMMRSDSFFTSNECSVAEHTMTWKIRRSPLKLLIPANMLLLQHLVTVNTSLLLSQKCFDFTHAVYAQGYLQSLAIWGDLRDLVMDPVDEVCVACCQEAILRHRKAHEIVQQRQGLLCYINH